MLTASLAKQKSNSVMDGFCNGAIYSIMEEIGNKTRTGGKYLEYNLGTGYNRKEDEYEYLTEKLKSLGYEVELKYGRVYEEDLLLIKW